MFFDFKIMATQAILKFVCCALLLSTLGCKEDIETDDLPTVFEVSKRPAGTAIGNSEKLSFGTAGGEFTSKSEDLKIEIPEGAVNGNATLTVQHITNTSPASFGNAYRISTSKPLSKPMTIKLSYENQSDSLPGEPECSISVSIQDSISGVWSLQTKRIINTSEKSIAYSTSSKVDISCVVPVRLTPAYSEIRPLDEMLLKVVSNIVIPREGLCAIYGNQTASLSMGDDYLVESALIDKWELLSTGEGKGTLTPKGNTALYKASAHELPAINPATILVFLKQTQRPLSAKVFVKPEVTGLAIWIGTKQYVFTDDMIDVSVESDGSLGMYWEGSGGQGSLNCQKNKVDKYTWNSTSNQFLFEPSDITPLQAFQQLFNDGTTVSEGNIRITKSGGVGQKISGSFEIASAGRTNTESGNGEYLGASKVVGIFNVMRDH